jgi:hypothetical protein
MERLPPAAEFAQPWHRQTAQCARDSWMLLRVHLSDVQCHATGKVEAAIARKRLGQALRNVNERRQAEQIFDAGGMFGIGLRPGARPRRGEQAHQGNAVVALTDAAERGQAVRLAVRFEIDHRHQQTALQARPRRQALVVENTERFREAVAHRETFTEQERALLIAGSLRAQGARQ